MQVEFTVLFDFAVSGWAMACMSMNTCFSWSVFCLFYCYYFLISHDLYTWMNSPAEKIPLGYIWVTLLLFAFLRYLKKNFFLEIWVTFSEKAMHKKSQILLKLLQIFLSKEMFSWCKHETVVPQFLFHFKGLDTEPTFLRLRGWVGWGKILPKLGFKPSTFWSRVYYLSYITFHLHVLLSVSCLILIWR